MHPHTNTNELSEHIYTSKAQPLWWRRWRQLRCRPCSHAAWAPSGPAEPTQANPCVYLRLKNIMKVSNTATQAKHRYWQQNTNIFHDWLSQLHLRYRSYILSYLCIDESWTGPKACMLCAFACRLLWWRSREHLAIMLCVNMALSDFDCCFLVSGSSNNLNFRRRSSQLLWL